MFSLNTTDNLNFDKTSNKFSDILVFNICNEKIDNFTKLQHELGEATKKLQNSKEYLEVKRIKEELEEYSKPYSLHKFFLQNSKMFQGVFSHDMIDNFTNTVNISHEDPENILPQVFQYLYTNSIQLNEQNCIGLYVFSHRFEIENLKKLCKELLTDNFINLHIFSILEKCLIYEETLHHLLDDNFFKKCLDKIAHNFSFYETSKKDLKYLGVDDFLYLMNQPLVVNSEFEIYLTMKNYLFENINISEEERFKIVKIVRVEYLKKNELKIALIDGIISKDVILNALISFPCCSVSNARESYITEVISDSTQILLQLDDLLCFKKPDQQISEFVKIPNHQYEKSSSGTDFSIFNLKDKKQMYQYLYHSNGNNGKFSTITVHIQTEPKIDLANVEIRLGTTKNEPTGFNSNCKVYFSKSNIPKSDFTSSKYTFELDSEFLWKKDENLIVQFSQLNSVYSGGGSMYKCSSSGNGVQYSHDNDVSISQILTSGSLMSDLIYIEEIHNLQSSYQKNIFKFPSHFKVVNDHGLQIPKE
jgi:translation initiation factor 2 beta subunit (eIF-2beta)/eIF-5